MLDRNGMPVEKRELAQANKAREFVDKCIRELTAWQGKRPTMVRINMKRYLILVQVGWIDSWPGIEVKGS